MTTVIEVSIALFWGSGQGTLLILVKRVFNVTIVAINSYGNTVHVTVHNKICNLEKNEQQMYGIGEEMFKNLNEKNELHASQERYDTNHSHAQRRMIVIQ